MNESLAALLEVAQTYLGNGFIVFLRVAAFAALLPGFGEQTVPVRVKLGVALAFTLVIAPAIPADVIAGSGYSILWLIVSEGLVGAMLGVGLRLFVLALQTAGSIAAQSTSLAQLLGNQSAEPVPAMGHILVVGGLALAMLSGLHVKAAQFIILSYDMLPVGMVPLATDLSGWGTARVSHAFALAFTLAAPFVVLSVLYNLGLGVINRAMPQLMVAFVGAPVITAGGLIILALATPLLLSTWLAAVDVFLLNPFETR
ncbi:flagellar biosynthetic protein FliR [Sulfitobacter sp. S190]|uniref:flagellar biosynthetic protein FliR n=1 Tax=Sulfitobacter sp. S190 TaxID=2867022 RepID=UPI0021A72245|nr:flagellar biosynthetic protein FliR [Sulfitobacter sp. S190]UWR22365.1 flagellar biosynthetic protein FliR [Sulfitobacter sp. S190]